ncbi:succinylglutamate desuccinylase [Musicola paradisiaca]|uniref:Succinylglutamate desuccinylase n=1 Tax=Musicola paradisiaca (strain Ech703) TaxID=579405 RepID=C6C8S8_MUSP7|nr:succinylglutamate desuccinylase [Musicola paradisiaca]ACS84299.1 succinylglutamate desuccinylase [Musicola paradisiaca Ech703]
MNDFLAQTLRGEMSTPSCGEQGGLRWRWLGEGGLELTPTAGYQRAVALSAGIHGNETAPIELLDRLAGDLLTGRLPLTVRLLLVLGNPAAIRAGKRYLHSDINRMFGGRHSRFPLSGETVRAHWLEQALTAFFAADVLTGGVERYHYDLHTAIRDSLLPRFGLLPFQERPYNLLLLESLTAAELDALVVHREPGGTFSHFSSEQLMAASCTLELGKARPLGENDLSQFDAIDQALRALVSGTSMPVRRVAPMRLFSVVRSLMKRSEAFQLHVAGDAPNFTPFARGTLLCEQPGEAYRVAHEREWILFPNPSVAQGLRAGMVLTEIAPGELAGGVLSQPAD